MHIPEGEGADSESAHYQNIFQHLLEKVKLKFIQKNISVSENIKDLTLSEADLSQLPSNQADTLNFVSWNFNVLLDVLAFIREDLSKVFPSLLVDPLLITPDELVASAIIEGLNVGSKEIKNFTTPIAVFHKAMMVLEQLQKEKPRKENKVAVDLGSGNGQTALRLAAMGFSKVIGIEFDHTLMVEAQKNKKKLHDMGATVVAERVHFVEARFSASPKQNTPEITAAFRDADLFYAYWFHTNFYHLVETFARNAKNEAVLVLIYGTADQASNLIATYKAKHPLRRFDLEVLNHPVEQSALFIQKVPRRISLKGLFRGFGPA